MYATQSFIHLDEIVTKGDDLPADHPLVVARPDLFTTTKPTAKRGKTPKE